ncbi:MAG: DUF192 domain-containing protein [Candidatus Liptonbacteria bacterium]|nr:DUF192 domain-containing protein [Candidatus Liptonbacteria bacterium]
MYLIFIVIVIVGFFAWWRRGRNMPPKTAALSVGGNRFTVEIADTMPLRERGLSGRERLEEGRGVLFVFGAPARHGFWMKGMKFALDFVWVSGGKVVGVTEHVPPPADSLFSLPMYYPPEPVDTMLEVNAGTVGKAGIKVGDKVEMVNL